ncbi:MAG TPA: sigma 54-interacting transcriptional regulator, partial [Gemmataceae bacterium]|nr:sigma 54-interacting transcriptional regulator [Gemmataceae bacterium]
MSSLREVHVPVSAAANGQMVPPRCLILGEVAISDTLLAQELGLHIQTVRNGTAALQTLTRQSCDIVLVDLHTPRVRGLAFLEAVANRRPPFAVIGVADPADIHQAVQGMRLGIFDVLPAPVCAPQLLAALRRALADRATRLKAANAADRGFPNLLGHSPAMAEVFRLISRVAPSRVTVLLEGETGTGKEQVARALHAGAPDRTGPFVPVNCAALPLTLLESELFGHVKGAFTDAVERRPGRLELADKGTLFLDEVSDIPLPMQAKLLRFLQERRFERLGGMDTLEVDVRVLGATHRCLRRLVRAGKFREDL